MNLLPFAEYHRLVEHVKEVTINNLFARWIIEGHLPGRVYVDDIRYPGTFYVVHPYGMSLLFGNCRNEKFNGEFGNYALNRNGKREKPEWMQAFPDEWDPVLHGLFKDHLVTSSDNVFNREEGIVELNTRINFRFNHGLYKEKRQEASDPDCQVMRTSAQFFGDMKGTVVPASFWKDQDHFMEKGIGFSLFCKGELASTAYSAFLLDKKLELGIETREKFRGKGFAFQACSALIDYCIDNDLEPVWACRLENTQSYRLAQKLGFEPIAAIPYYRLGI